MRNSKVLVTVKSSWIVSSAQACVSAIDIGKSGTWKEELLVDKGTLSKMWVLRRILMPMGSLESMEFLLPRLKEKQTNEDFFRSMNQ